MTRPTNCHQICSWRRFRPPKNVFWKRRGRRENGVTRRYDAVAMRDAGGHGVLRWSEPWPRPRVFDPRVPEVGDEGGRPLEGEVVELVQ